MFDKEAEEYAKSKKIKDDCIRFYDTKKHFIDGAEFGYNKANEWHYITNKDFPNTKGEYLVCRSKSKYSILAFDGSFWITGVQDDPYDNIIAWKEIVPPKEDLKND